MELWKNRKVKPCHWETQPSGCLKLYCPFFHSKNQGKTSDIKSQAISKQSVLKKTDSCAKNASQANKKSFGNPVVKSLAINLKEDSDSESEPTQSPVKIPPRITVKTLEEIRLEEVETKSTAYYSKKTKKRQKLALKIETLEEITDENGKRVAAQTSVLPSSETRTNSTKRSSKEFEVNITSKNEEYKEQTKAEKKLQIVKIHPIKRLKRTRINDSILNTKKVKLEEATEEKESEIAVEKMKIFEHSCDKLEIPQCNNEEDILNNNCASDSSQLDEVLLLHEEDLLKDINAMLNK
ncbi:hypothetical protein Trydic_g4186 [Trypoxylus dichotomus]